MATRAPALTSPIWPWLLVSGLVHAMLAIAAIGTLGAGLLLEGRGVADGDGFGGHSIEIEIRGPRSDAPGGSIEGAPPSSIPIPVLDEMPELGDAPPQVAPEEAPRATEEAPPAADEGTVEVAAAERPPRPAELVPMAPLPGAGDDPEEGAIFGTDEGSPGEDTPAGTGGDDSTAGAQAGDPSNLILGSAGLGGDRVSARRLLLPNGGACEDPVVGTWRAQKFRSSDRSWVRFVLRVRRAGGDQLEGTITSRIWSGNASDPTPGECTAYGFDHEWRMRARGSFVGDDLRFESRHAQLVREYCPRSGTQYAPDRFHGTVQPLRGVFHAVNNDGAFDIDEPYTFTRMSCDP